MNSLDFIKKITLMGIMAVVVTGQSLNETDSLGTKETSYEAQEVALKSPAQILKLRGFKTEVYYARTKDGYFIHLVRINNPEVKRHKRPVIFNHGFLGTSTCWLISSKDVKPKPLDTCSGVKANGTDYLNGPMMLSNAGYDVWLMSMRGTDFALRHEKPNFKTDKEFWNYSLDDFAMSDVPTAIDYVRNKTNSLKVGYVGHSQATFSIFGLLSMRPDYADVVEPVIAVAPVAFFDHITSVARAIFLGYLKATGRNTHGPFPKMAKKWRTNNGNFCVKTPLGTNKAICDLVHALVEGKGKHWPLGFFTHLPFYSSLKVVRHFGLLIKNKRFMMYDYGAQQNLKRYGSTEAPSYPIGNIRSKSICLFYTKTDALSALPDVERFKKELNVPLYRDVFIDKPFNHFDLLTDVEAANLVYEPMLEIFESFEASNGTCSSKEPILMDNQKQQNFIDSKHLNQNQQQAQESHNGQLEGTPESKELEKHKSSGPSREQETVRQDSNDLDSKQVNPKKTEMDAKKADEIEKEILGDMEINFD